VRPGLGANVKNSLFAEFTIPRAGEVRVEVFNLVDPFDTLAPDPAFPKQRLFLSLFGYKVYGA
jgi:hypothetical protein